MLLVGDVGEVVLLDMLAIGLPPGRRSHGTPLGVIASTACLRVTCGPQIGVTVRIASKPSFASKKWTYRRGQ